ncbi:hypothetical protein EYF80_012107 [Liparis tanakae]|uniref:Uncharacterized protein n=1 Tax=Liparis tanakae TaxID=230148 RepID=A0A4Z2IIH6_9TELE|nr:hypothetical protein EYF80_012107 [Liparis tanakae]
MGEPQDRDQDSGGPQDRDQDSGGPQDRDQFSSCLFLSPPLFFARERREDGAAWRLTGGPCVVAVGRFLALPRSSSPDGIQAVRPEAAEPSRAREAEKTY